MKASELQNKSVEELRAELLNLSEQQFKLHIRKATGQLSQTHLLQATKREIARVKTMLKQKAGN